MNRSSWGVKTLYLITAALLLPRSAIALPDQFEARYAFIGKGMTLGETRYQLLPTPPKNGNSPSYVFSTHTKPTGLAAMLIDKTIDERSEWQRQEGKIHPLNYQFRQSGKRKKIKSRSFHWELGQVSLVDDKHTKQLDGLKPGTVDEALFILALMDDLEQGKKPLHYPLAKQKGWSEYVFERGLTETIQVPAGKFETVKVVRHSSGQRSFQLWAAPSLNYLPVQIEYREKDGELFQLKLKQSTLHQ
ncbi:MAG: DUF3108 domain-containing protein [Gammaproteobacteria bacterium]|jgi:hypothetical protein|nr:DUF3108 domain-containing protein [Gammaproteobacteria bacterium]MBT3488623.1 DUF3108 domain-containing protein [Gammaproteobacteria bacterium]MBT3718272.1 DUF3108 domain-containing protein [Gammaproteobacteria bacterium]MBT3846132.1 DUF3108 domain-containing protein [Gammaproteobacteria bacterium]MBT3893160.1 DUF3108 domain-containing protein [Gammaproteobacteria bacterium]